MSNNNVGIRVASSKIQNGINSVAVNVLIRNIYRMISIEYIAFSKLIILFFLIFIYLTALDLSCSTRALHCRV